FEVSSLRQQTGFADPARNANHSSTPSELDRAATDTGSHSPQLFGTPHAQHQDQEDEDEERGRSRVRGGEGGAERIAAESPERTGRKGKRRKVSVVRCPLAVL
ncbi:hypothetical protein HK102_001108, partial [Quaeritorhiza haematococci]